MANLDEELFSYLNTIWSNDLDTTASIISSNVLDYTLCSAANPCPEEAIGSDPVGFEKRKATEKQIEKADLQAVINTLSVLVTNLSNPNWTNDKVNKLADAVTKA